MASDQKPPPRKLLAFMYSTVLEHERAGLRIAAEAIKVRARLDAARGRKEDAQSWRVLAYVLAEVADGATWIDALELGKYALPLTPPDKEPKK